MTVPVPPTGRQHEIRSGAQRAVITEVGAALRELYVDDVPVLDGFAVDEMSTPARGCPLIPWPNRIGQGRYVWDGVEHQVPINEPEKGHALHGYARFLNWTAAPQEPEAATMNLRLHAQQGYPFVLDLSIRYALDDSGLTVTAGARNVGTQPAPYGYGAHPYLTVGTKTLDDALLHLPAATYLPTDDAGLPAGREPVAATEYDLRTPQRIGSRQLDHAFTDLERDSEGRAWLALSRPEGDRTVRMWVDEHVHYLQVFTGDSVPDPDRRRQGLGAEPMTCPPNAFRTGEDVQRLQPGEEFVCRWGIVAQQNR